MILLRQCKNQFERWHLCTHFLWYNLLTAPIIGSLLNEQTCALANVELHDRAESVGILHQVEASCNLFLLLVGSLALEVAMKHIFKRSLLLSVPWLRHGEHIRQAMRIGKGCILLASLQQEGKLTQLLGTGVEVDTREVVAEDILHSLSTTIAFGNIKVIEQVETLVENMAGTAGKVCYL